MRTEHTRQTRWAGGPENIDPREVPPGSVYAREMVWAACADCDLQVHTSYGESLIEGVRCPECGRLVLAPLPLEERKAATAKVEREEARFRQPLPP